MTAGAALLVTIVVTHDASACGTRDPRGVRSPGGCHQTAHRSAPRRASLCCNQAYASAASERLDVYRRAGSTRAQPTVLRVHGGGWLSGDKADAEKYFRPLPGAEITVASVNYFRTPEHRYPLPACSRRRLGFVGRVIAVGGDGCRA